MSIAIVLLIAGGMSLLFIDALLAIVISILMIVAGLFGAGRD